MGWKSRKSSPWNNTMVILGKILFQTTFYKQIKVLGVILRYRLTPTYLPLNQRKKKHTGGP